METELSDQSPFLKKKFGHGSLKSKFFGPVQFFFYFFTLFHCSPYPANIYLFKVNNKNTRARCGKFSELTITIP